MRFLMIIMGIFILGCSSDIDSESETIFNRIYIPQSTYIDQSLGLVNFNGIGGDQYSVDDDFNGILGIRQQVSDYSSISNIINQNFIVNEIELISETEIRIDFETEVAFDTILNYNYANSFKIPELSLEFEYDSVSNTLNYFVDISGIGKFNNLLNQYNYLLDLDLGNCDSNILDRALDQANSYDFMPEDSLALYRVGIICK